MKIVVLEALRIGNDVAFDCLKEFGELVVYPETNSYEEARARIADADVVIVDQFPMNEKALGKAQRLKLITMTSTGTDFVDLAYTNTRNIQVSNIRGYSTFSVAQHTVTMLLSLYEHLDFYNNYVKSGAYIGDTANTSFLRHFHDLSGKVWGIVGLGQIGSQVARIAEALGCEIIYFSPSGNPHSDRYECVSFETLLEKSNVISCHAPLSDKTRGIFNGAAFRKMKRDAVLINAARGGLVVEEELKEALLSGEIAGAGLDVLCEEPMRAGSPLSEILSLDNLIITPHIGWASVESRTKAIEEIYLNIQSFINGEPRNRVL